MASHISTFPLIVGVSMHPSRATPSAPSRLAFALAAALASPALLAAPSLNQDAVSAQDPASPQTSEPAFNSWTLDTLQVRAKRDSYTASESSAATRTDTPLLQVPQSVQILRYPHVLHRKHHLLAHCRRQCAQAPYPP